jgi:hypothetical protein
MSHTVYVKVEAAGTAAARREPTLRVLRYIKQNLDTLKKMGISIRVQRIRDEDVKDERVVSLMKSKGISRLPALSTAKNTYTGAQEIIGLYQKNIASFTKKRAPAPVQKTSDVATYMQNVMDGPEDDDDGLGEGSENMMDTYRQTISRRETQAPPRSGNLRTTPNTKVEGRSMRADNVAPPPLNRPPPRPQASRPPPSRPPPRQPQSAPMLGGEDEEDNSAQDDLMERAWLANQDESMPGPDEEERTLDD